MTDYYGHVLAVETGPQGTFRVRVTDDRSRVLAKLLKKRGFSLLPAQRSGSEGAAEVNRLDPVEPKEDDLIFSSETDADTLQDLLDSLTFLAEGRIVQEVLI